jgi:hypothetical protein
MTLPNDADYFYGIICTSCAKRLVIGYGDYIDGSDKKEFCLSVLIEGTFGEAWGQSAEKQCRCSTCKKKRAEQEKPTLEQLAREHEG